MRNEILLKYAPGTIWNSSKTFHHSGPKCDFISRILTYQRWPETTMPSQGSASRLVYRLLASQYFYCYSSAYIGTVYIPVPIMLHTAPSGSFTRLSSIYTAKFCAIFRPNIAPLSRRKTLDKDSARIIAPHFLTQRNSGRVQKMDVLTLLY